jgi:site-specific DNA-methyltransferase (adenine-specific)
MSSLSWPDDFADAVLCFDCLDVLRQMPDNCVDAVVTDPPYGLEFMGKEWDKLWTKRDKRGKRGFKNTGEGGRTTDPYLSAAVDKYIGGSQAQEWHYRWAVEVLRVAKPGAHLLAFGGTRTWHRLAVAIEDAGWEIRDTLMWLHGQGFPKSLDVSKAIDRMAGAEREVTGMGPYAGRRPHANHDTQGITFADDAYVRPSGDAITAPATPAARQWQGWGSALKPAWEPVLLCRKPLSEPTLAANVLRWGCGGLNIDECRISLPAGDEKVGGFGNGKVGYGGGEARGVEWQMKTNGRWPANACLTHNFGCRKIGVKRVKPKEGYRPNPVGVQADGNIQFTEKPVGYQKGSYTEPDGCEEVAAWECARGPDGEVICPVEMLDLQSGEVGSWLEKPVDRPEDERNPYGIYGSDSRARTITTYADTGGASRFFKQCTYGDEDWLCAPGCPLRLLDEQGGELHSNSKPGMVRHLDSPFGVGNNFVVQAAYGDTGGASRFFYCGKAARRERWFFCTDCQEAYPPGDKEQHGHGHVDAEGRQTWQHIVWHPTQKPLNLVKWLVRLVTRPGGIILDPFLGTGTTALAAKLEGFHFVGIDSDPIFCRIAERRLTAVLL